MRRLAARIRHHDWFAAGIELAIVVAGILIALQVSNWNQDRADAKRGRAYLERIRADLDTDLRVNAARARFQVQVRRYGEQALAHADRGERVGGSAWKTVLAYFQAGQFYAYSRERSTFDEMREAGDLGLITDPKLRSELAYFYGSGVNRVNDDTVMNLVPQYRQDIRSVTPIAVQDYIWQHCFRLVGSTDNDQRMIDCPAPISELRANAILADYARHPELALELRYWLSNQRIDALTYGKERRNMLDLKAGTERQLRR